MIITHHFDNSTPIDEKILAKLLPQNYLLEITPRDMENKDGTEDSAERGIWIWNSDFPSTGFYLRSHATEGCTLHMDGMASSTDYKFFPYLVDTLQGLLNDNRRSSAFQTYDEEWAAYEMGEAVAEVKAVLSLGATYQLELCVTQPLWLSAETLAAFAVSTDSSTPRIYNYSQFLLQKQLAHPERFGTPPDPQFTADGEVLVDIPQHCSIGRVRSWQTDGSETWESFSAKDVEMLIELGESVATRGANIDGEVLNDLGTIYQEGIGVVASAKHAIYWFEAAIAAGERCFAPCNLGDLYRKGCAEQAPSLPQAYRAYARSNDPYALYRMGQAWEEGWLGEIDIERAESFFSDAAKRGHHLALRRYAEKNIDSLNR